MLAVKKFLDRVLAAACVALFAVLVLTVSWQVFSRQVLNAPSNWSEQLAKYVFVWLGMFGAALVFSERGHIAVDFLIRKCPAGVQRGAAVVVQLAVIAFAALALIWGGSRMVLLTWDQNLTVLPTQVGPLHLVMPVTGVIITLYAVYHLVSVLRGEEAAIETDDSTEAI
ncbi:TRAP transporter small permease [Streptomyces cavernicola]|uniref:TRAP transporter small permease n=1 Tax=Streptomyces cavernicola TaxID=3043613 RepID=A0ABT6S5P2_9ACTN|nr:TRAP transporter small permease [Streptomyces sp. B-S-A6]MDI3403412.1 TRAP transporter small permease [Streptomyces sp. B-S-A6]